MRSRRTRRLRTSRGAKEATAGRSTRRLSAHDRFGNIRDGNFPTGARAGDEAAGYHCRRGRWRQQEESAKRPGAEAGGKTRSRTCFGAGPSRCRGADGGNVSDAAAVSSVGQSEIQSFGQGGDIENVLRSIPGVSTVDSTNNPGIAINIRGFEGSGRVNMSIDGVRQNFQVLQGHLRRQHRLALRHLRSRRQRRRYPRWGKYFQAVPLRRCQRFSSPGPMRSINRTAASVPS